MTCRRCGYRRYVINLDRSQGGPGLFYRSIQAKQGGRFTALQERMEKSGSVFVCIFNID